MPSSDVSDAAHGRHLAAVGSRAPTAARSSGGTARRCRRPGGRPRWLQRTRASPPGKCAGSPYNGTPLITGQIFKLPPPAMIHLDRQRSPRDLLPAIERLFELSAQKIRSIEDTWQRSDGAPVFTVAGRYQARGWTEWTAGVPVRLGAAAVRRDRRRAVPRARPRAHASSAWRRTSPTWACTITASTTSAPTATCGGWRAKGGSRRATGRSHFYELALKVSGAVQARRWTRLPERRVTSTRSTARTRSSSTPSARCARWRSATCSASV